MSSRNPASSAFPDGRQRFIRAGAALLVLFLPGNANAEPGDACVSSYEGAQEQRRENDPLRERGEIRLCLGSCPSELARDCLRWLTEVEPKIGRIRVETPNVEAAELALEIDGARQSSLDVEVNPGERRIRLTATGYSPLEEVVVVLEGQKVVFTKPMEALPPPPAVSVLPRLVAEEAWAPSIPGFLLSGLGVSALVASLGLSIDGHLLASELRESCSPNCTSKEVKPIKSEWIAAGIVGGVGVASLATGVILVATHTETQWGDASVLLTPRGAFVVGSF